MTQSTRTNLRLSLALGCLAMTSACNGPPRVDMPYIDGAGAGSLAIDEYDANHDGIVSDDEFQRVPALKAALPRLDTNNDGGVSADEIAARVAAWEGMGIGLASLRCRVTLDGQPLTGATVVFEPEAFLGDEIRTATGKTNQYGDASPTVPPEERPAPNLPGGGHLGLYKVRITKIVDGKETIPARYNTETTLGQEVASDDPGLRSNNLTFALTSGE